MTTALSVPIIQTQLAQATTIKETRQVEAVFRVSDSDDEQFTNTNLPRFLVGAWREMRGLPRDKYSNAMNYLNLFLQEIGWNK